MSDNEKIVHQGKGSDKVRFEFMLETVNRQYLKALADFHGVSVAKILNAILRAKPQPQDFYLP